MTLKLKAMAEEDKSFFRTVHHLAYRQVIESMFGWNEAMQDAAADKEFSERRPKFISDNERVVGVVGLQEKSDHLWFGPLYILPEFQGQGIGSRVVRYFIEIAKVKDIPIRLRTLKANLGAKAMYERSGFRVSSESDIHWHMEYLPGP